MRLKTERTPHPADMDPSAPRLAWLAAVRRGDRGAFSTTVRHTQERLACHLLGALRLPPDQALELTRQTVLDALETAGQGTAIESPLARLFGTARARLRDRLQATFGDAPGLDAPFDPEPDSALLRAFHAGDRTVDRQLAHRRDLLPFLELMHEVVQSLPDEPRAVLAERWAPDDPAGDEPTRYPPALLALAGAALMAHTRPGYCAVFDEHLSRAGWRPGEPLGQPRQQSLVYHVGACGECRPSHQQAEQRIGTLPPLVLWTALRLDEHRREILATIFDEPAAAAGSATTILPAPVSPAPAPSSRPGTGRQAPASPARTESARTDRDGGTGERPDPEQTSRIDPVAPDRRGGLPDGKTRPGRPTRPDRPAQPGRPGKGPRGGRTGPAGRSDQNGRGATAVANGQTGPASRTDPVDRDGRGGLPGGKDRKDRKDRTARKGRTDRKDRTGRPGNRPRTRGDRDRGRSRLLAAWLVSLGLLGLGGWGLGLALLGDGRAEPLAIDTGPVGNPSSRNPALQDPARQDPATQDPVTGDPTASGPRTTSGTGATSQAPGQPATSSAGASSTAAVPDPTTADPATTRPGSPGPTSGGP
ncbi:MAG TPA: hypothetical protein VMU51_14705, partial [Mycobacteriales bacterium]|nr:hypothetical protein [Mycobacteriales bacterium]